MSRPALAALICLIFAAAPAAAQPPPHVKVGTPYFQAKARLQKAGFVPAHIVKNGDDCGGRNASCASEHIYCAADIDHCEWLFVRRSDEAFFVVVTGYGPTPSVEDGGFVKIFRASPRYLRDFDLTVITPNGKRRAFPYPVPNDKHTPLCSQADVTPCWVKPPPGFKPLGRSTH